MAADRRTLVVKGILGPKLSRPGKVAATPPIGTFIWNGHRLQAVLPGERLKFPMNHLFLALVAAFLPAEATPYKEPPAVETRPRGVRVQIPAGRRIVQALFSPDSKSLAIILGAADGLELAIADVATGASGKVTEARLSGAPRHLGQESKIVAS